MRCMRSSSQDWHAHPAGLRQTPSPRQGICAAWTRLIQDPFHFSALSTRAIIILFLSSICSPSLLFSPPFVLRSAQNPSVELPNLHQGSQGSLLARGLIPTVCTPMCTSEVPANMPALLHTWPARWTHASRAQDQPRYMHAHAFLPTLAPTLLVRLMLHARSHRSLRAPHLYYTGTATLVGALNPETMYASTSHGSARRPHTRVRSADLAALIRTARVT